MQDSTRIKWNQRYQRAIDGNQLPEPAQVLTQYAYLLPEQGCALDVACGLGGNALYLARRMLQVDAWDLSDVAIGQLSQRMKREKLTITAQTRDILHHPPEPERYDVIVVSRFLERSIITGLIQALKPAGLIFYQTFIKNKDPGVGPNNPRYLLAENELLVLFSSLHILVYHDEGKVGDCRQGLRNEAVLIAQKPGGVAPNIR